MRDANYQRTFKLTWHANSCDLMAPNDVSRFGQTKTANNYVIQKIETISDEPQMSLLHPRKKTKQFQPVLDINFAHNSIEIVQFGY